MQPTLKAIRSISSEFASRLFLPIAITAAVILVTLLVVAILLTTFSEWWWVLVIILSLVVIIAGVLCGIAGAIIYAIKPTQTKDQKQQVKTMVDKMQRVSEVTVTPKFILLFNVIKDVVVPSKEGFISSITGDTTSLKNDFTNLRDSFK